MKNQQHPQPPQISPKTAFQPTIHQKKQQFNQFFTELLQKNQSLVQIFEQQSQRTYEYPQVNVEKLRSNSSFRQFTTRDSNSNSNNSKNVNPIDVIKLKDILNANGKPKKEIKIDPQLSQKASPKYNATHLTDLLSVNNQQLQQKLTAKPSPKIQLYNQCQVQEKNLQLTNKLIRELQKENKNLDIETPRFYGMT
ncbi:unnamed protein product [Paramecium octaurelia]|uniref:Uncharacterized protein n=1 Tax=Paramecium octaurelia TaxID=43137 RepID=A0A8S1W038_PAROT|nr:unnamed protein product [Paramecium octaurelia]